MEDLPAEIFVTADEDTKDLNAWRSQFDAASDDGNFGIVGVYRLVDKVRARKAVEVKTIEGEKRT